MNADRRRKTAAAVVMALVLTLSLCACGGGGGEGGGGGGSEDDAAAGTADAQQLACWNGYWYGYWISGNATEAYDYANDAYYECCAGIELDENGEGYIIIWDEVLPQSSPAAIAEVQLTGDEEGGSTLIGAGRTGGVFSAGEWTVDNRSSGLEDMVEISGIYEDEDGSFEYVFILRPWGTLWDDIDESWLPMHYTDWYLPLIEAGVTTPPDTIEF